MNKALIHVVNLYLDDKYSEEKAKITALAASTDSSATETLEGYVREALRLDPPIPGVHRTINCYIFFWITLMITR
jgi:linoleate 10R-lipoxygenase